MEKTIKYQGRYRPEEILDLSKNTLDEIESILSKENLNIKIIILPEQIAVDLARDQVLNFPNLREIIWPKANKIAAYLFDSTKLKYISIEECEIIDSYAFYMSKLTEVKLPKNLKTLCGSAFCDCTQLKRVDMSNINAPIAIPDYCFNNNHKLTSIDFNKIYSIGVGAFGETGFSSLSLPDSVKLIHTSAFSKCEIKTLTFNGNVKFEGRGHFASCINLEEVDINNNLYSISDNCFSGCKNLKIIKNAKTITQIGISAFNETGITEINMPALERIGDWAFRLSQLNNIVIPNTVTTVGIGAFYKCSDLKNVQWSINCKVIEDYTFNSCKNLVSLKRLESVEKLGSKSFEWVIGDIEFLNLNSIEPDSFLHFAGKADLRKTAIVCSEVPTKDNILLPYYY